MLTMEQGKTLRGISSETGHHFNTVKKYAEKENFNLELNPGKSKPRKLTPYAELIDSWLFYFVFSNQRFSQLQLLVGAG